MENLLFRLLIFAYASTALITVIGYWPTIKDLYYRKKPSANVKSYILWTIDTGIVVLYSLFALPDPLFIIVSGFNFVCCALILILRIKLDKI